MPGRWFPRFSGKAVRNSEKLEQSGEQALRASCSISVWVSWVDISTEKDSM